MSFLAITLLLPFLLVAALEVALRAANYGGDLSLFTRFSLNGEEYVSANQRVGARYFPREHLPPAPSAEPFLAIKPEHGFRAFVLGESAAAGFPFVANASVADFVQSALEELLPGDTIEVVNLGIAATNSYTIADLASEVIAQSPDAVLIYAGHNEYYGALGVGSSERLAAAPALGRLYLTLQRFRTVRLLRDAIDRVARGQRGSGATAADSAVTRMETVARDQRILYKSATYERGKSQFESNLRAALGEFRRARIPVFIGTVASNVRDLAPFAALSGADTMSGAATAYRSARQALDAADVRTADSLFTLARDEDFIRFRAPSDFNVIIRRVARTTGAHVVTTEDDIRRASEFHIPGADLFFEHVHLRSRGYGLIGRSFVAAMQNAKIFTAPLKPIASVEHYDSALALTALDQRIAEHSINTVKTRWPFVPAQKSQDYRATYRPVDTIDSLALAVSRGGLRWDRAKLTLAARYESSGKPELALPEYKGLIRHEPLFEGGYEGAGRTFLALGKRDSAEYFLQRGYALEPTGGAAFSLGVLALERKNLRSAIRLLEESVRLQPANPAAFYRLSFAYALARDIDRARASAVRVYRLQPAYPGLTGWLKTLGIPPPTR